MDLPTLETQFTSLATSVLCMYNKPDELQLIIVLDGIDTSPNGLNAINNVIASEVSPEYPHTEHYGVDGDRLKAVYYKTT